ncbi:hypothetical protein QBC39DRAFT_364458, partial [Podospora conica]
RPPPTSSTPDSEAGQEARRRHPPVALSSSSQPSFAPMVPRADSPPRDTKPPRPTPTSSTPDSEAGQQARRRHPPVAMPSSSQANLASMVPRADSPPRVTKPPRPPPTSSTQDPEAGQQQAKRRYPPAIAMSSRSQASLAPMVPRADSPPRVIKPPRPSSRPSIPSSVVPRADSPPRSTKPPRPPRSSNPSWAVPRADTRQPLETATSGGPAGGARMIGDIFNVVAQWMKWGFLLLRWVICLVPDVCRAVKTITEVVPLDQVLQAVGVRYDDSNNVSVAGVLTNPWWVIRSLPQVVGAVGGHDHLRTALSFAVGSGVTGAVVWSSCGYLLTGAQYAACSYVPMSDRLLNGWCDGVTGSPQDGAATMRGDFASQFQIETPWSEITTAGLDVYTVTQLATEVSKWYVAEARGSTSKNRPVSAAQGERDRLNAQTEATGPVIFARKALITQESAETQLLQRRLLRLLETVRESPVSGKSAWQRLRDEHFGGGGSDRQVMADRIDKARSVVERALERRGVLVKQLEQPLPLMEFCLSQEKAGGPQASRVDKRDQYSGDTHKQRVQEMQYRLEHPSYDRTRMKMPLSAEELAKQAELEYQQGPQEISGKLIERVNLLCSFCRSAAASTTGIMKKVQGEHVGLSDAFNFLSMWQTEVQSWGVMVSEQVIRDKEKELGRVLEELIKVFGVTRRG